MKRLLFVFTLVVCSFILQGDGFGQAINRTQGDITCAASGSSTQVLAQNGRRLAITFFHAGSVTLRFGYLASGTATLTASNSQQLPAGGSYSESFPTVWLGRVVCMSTDATTQILSFTEIRK